MSISLNTLISLPIEFPLSEQDKLIVTSPPVERYNCIAWAFGDNTRFYWPASKPFAYWPKNVPDEETLSAFVMLYESIGFVVCSNGDLEKGFRKIAIYTNLEGKPTHASKQLPDGKWSSKLGRSYDVAHNLNTLDGPVYGKIKVFMKKKK